MRMRVCVFACLGASLALGSVRSLPATGMTALQDPASPQRDLVRLIAQLGNKKSASLRYVAYSQLLRKLSPEAIPLLMKALPDYPVQALSRAFTLLGRYPKELSTPALRELITCGKGLVELGAACELYRQGDQSLAASILGILKKTPPDGDQVEDAARQVFWITWLPAIQDDLRASLVAELGCQELDAILGHLLLAGAREHTKEVEALLDQDGLGVGKRLRLHLFLVACAREPVWNGLVAALGASTNKQYIQLRKYLDRVGQADAGILAGVSAFLDNNLSKRLDPKAASHAVQLLGKFRYRRGLSLVRQLLVSTDNETSKAAFEAYSKLGGKMDRALRHSLLASQHAFIVLQIAEELRIRDDYAGLMPVQRILERGGSHRVEALGLLARFRSPEVVLPLLVGLEDKSSTVRLAAYIGLNRVLKNLYPYRSFDIDTTGYSINAGPTKRAIAVTSLRAWWGGMLQSR